MNDLIDVKERLPKLNQCVFVIDDRYPDMWIAKYTLDGWEVYSPRENFVPSHWLGVTEKNPALPQPPAS